MWFKKYFYYILHIEGKICKSFGASHFNKEASKNNQQLSDVEHAMLEQDNPSDTVMTSAQMESKKNYDLYSR